MSDFTIKIDYEMREKIFQQILTEDYEMVKNDIHTLFMKDGYLKPHEQEDLLDFLDIKKAMERMIRYYFTREEAEEILGE